MAEVLRYGRVPMRREPINISWAGLIERMRREDAVRVVLEPGDGTRYDLVLARVGGALFLTRYVGGDSAGTELVNEWSAATVARILSCGNSWSEQLLAWWLRELLEEFARV